MCQNIRHLADILEIRTQIYNNKLVYRAKNFCYNLRKLSVQSLGITSVSHIGVTGLVSGRAGEKWQVVYGDRFFHFAIVLPNGF